MKKNLLLSIVVCSMMASSCSTDEVLIPEATPDETGLSTIPDYNASDSRYASKEEIANVIGHNRNSRAASDCRIDIIKDGYDPVAYVVNYGEEEGWQIISARKDYYPVLAYNDEGYFNLNDIYDCGVIDWVEAMKEDVRNIDKVSEDTIAGIRNMWRQYEVMDISADANFNRISASSYSSDDYYIAQGIMMDSISAWRAKGYEVKFPNSDGTGDESWATEMFEWLQTCTHPIYEEWWTNLVAIVRKDWADVDETPNFMLSTWGQIAGYNQSFPYLSDVKIADAGCGPVAVGQIMRYFEYPKSYSWSSMPYNYATKTTSDLLHEIAENCDPNYTSDGTGTDWDKLGAFLRKKGYNVNSNSNFNTDGIASKHPIMVYGIDYSIKKAHTWLLTGINTFYGKSEWFGYAFKMPQKLSCCSKANRQQDTYTRNHYYCNWGWSGKYDGFYRFFQVSDYNFSSIKTFSGIYPK